MLFLLSKKNNVVKFDKETFEYFIVESDFKHYATYTDYYLCYKPHNIVILIGRRRDHRIRDKYTEMSIIALFKVQTSYYYNILHGNSVDSHSEL